MYEYDIPSDFSRRRFVLAFLSTLRLISALLSDFPRIAFRYRLSSRPPWLSQLHFSFFSVSYLRICYCLNGLFIDKSSL